MEHQWDQGEGEERLEDPLGDGEEAEGDGEEHHGSPSVQPGGHQDLGAPPGHQAAWTLSLQQTQPGIWLTDCYTFFTGSRSPEVGAQGLELPMPVPLPSH